MTSDDREANVVDDPPWRRLAPGMLLIEPIREIIRFIPMLIVLVFAGRAGESGPPWGLIGAVAVVLLGISRWLTTRYRITPTVVELQRGLLQRTHLTVPRDRVRTVDVSAHPLQRVLGLVKVEIGTGSSHHRAEQLRLDGLPATAAGRLRGELLHRLAAPAGSSGGPTPSPGDDAPDATRHADAIRQPDEVELARLDPRWIAYAPATLSGVITAAFLAGLAWRIANEARLNPAQFSLFHDGVRYLLGHPLWLDVVVVVAAVMVVVSVLSVAGYVLTFWGFRLSRHDGGTLRVSRGLLTTRATSFEERRLRGAQRSEPILLRMVGGARLHAIATGLRQRGAERGGSLLMPPAPLDVVIGVEQAVLSGGPADLSTATLRSHGRAAHRRRYTRAVGAATLLAAGLSALTLAAHWPTGLLATWLLLILLAVPLAWDRYRNLGHAVVDGYLLVRAGSLVRRRTVLAIPGIIGVTLRQSFFQRRVGLISVTATTAAGSQHYHVPDVAGPAAVDLAIRLLSECHGFAIPDPATYVYVADGTDNCVVDDADERAADGAQERAPDRPDPVLRDGRGVSRLPA